MSQRRNRRARCYTTSWGHYRAECELSPEESAAVFELIADAYDELVWQPRALARWEDEGGALGRD